MRSQAQYTIYSLNDVITSSTAPTNPYKGQLWVDISQSPPVTKVYNGSSWVEQNGTDTIRSNISTLTTQYGSLTSSMGGLASYVSSFSTRIQTLETDTGDIQEDILSIQEDVSTLEQTATEIAAEVSNKVDDEYGTSASSFGWKLKSDGFYIYSNATTVASITSSGLSVTGAITASSGSLSNMTITGKLFFGGNTTYYISANYNDSNYYIYLPGLRVDAASRAVFSGQLSAPSGTIGGFTIASTAIYKTKTSYNDSNSGVYIGSTGIGLGAGTFYVTSAGKLYATDAEISGKITSSEGSIGGFTINSTSLTNTTGTSYIQITSGNYVTRLSANSISGSYDSENGNTGWHLNLNEISIANYDSVYSGIKLLPYYTKRTNSTNLSLETIYEGCITSVKDTVFDEDTSAITRTATPFIVGIPREYKKSPYNPFNEWGAYARFVNFQTAELVYDSAYSGKWKLRNVSGSTYDLTTLIPYLNSINGKKYYVWNYSSSLGGDSWASLTSSTHGLTSVTGAIAVARSTSSSLSGYNYNACMVVRISGTTVYVGNDNGSANSGFYCVIFGTG